MPPPPTVPDIAENPIILINVTVIDRIIPGKASTKRTSNIISFKFAPIDILASIIPSSISDKAPSTSLAKKAIEATVSGTEAAIGPIVVPVSFVVIGTSNTNNIIKGIDLIIFIINPAILLTIVFLYSKVFVSLHMRFFYV